MRPEAGAVRPCCLALNQAVPQGEGHGLQPAVDLKLGEDVADVISGSGRADEKLLGDGPRRGARTQQAEDIALSAGFPSRASSTPSPNSPGCPVAHPAPQASHSGPPLAMP